MAYQALEMLSIILTSPDQFASSNNVKSHCVYNNLIRYILLINIYNSLLDLFCGKIMQETLRLYRLLR